MKRILLLSILLILVLSLSAGYAYAEVGRYQILEGTEGVPFLVDTKTGKVWKFSMIFEVEERERRQKEGRPVSGFEPVAIFSSKDKWSFTPE